MHVAYQMKGPIMEKKNIIFIILKSLVFKILKTKIEENKKPKPYKSFEKITE